MWAILVYKFGFNQNSSEALFRMWAILVYEFGLIKILKKLFYKLGHLLNLSKIKITITWLFPSLLEFWMMNVRVV